MRNSWQFHLMDPTHKILQLLSGANAEAHCIIWPSPVALSKSWFTMWLSCLRDILASTQVWQQIVFKVVSLSTYLHFLDCLATKKSCFCGVIHERWAGKRPTHRIPQRTSVSIFLPYIILPIGLSSIRQQYALPQQPRLFCILMAHSKIKICLQTSKASHWETLVIHQKSLHQAQLQKNQYTNPASSEWDLGGR